MWLWRDTHPRESEREEEREREIWNRVKLFAKKYSKEQPASLSEMLD